MDRNFNPEIALPEPALSGKTGFFADAQNDRSEGACNGSKAKVSLRGVLATKQSKFIAISFVFILGFVLSSFSYADPLTGEELFKKKCKQCHRTTEQVLIGPGLKEVTKRRSIEWIDRWLIDPKKMLENDPIAQELKKNFKRIMPKIPEMSDDKNREDVIEYLKTL